MGSSRGAIAVAYVVHSNADNSQSSQTPANANQGQAPDPAQPVAPTPAVPQKAIDVLKHVKEKNGSPPARVQGGKEYSNTTKKLPVDGSYKEYDVDPKQKGIEREHERIVIDTKSGKAWYSPDHYDTFIPMP